MTKTKYNINVVLPSLVLSISEKVYATDIMGETPSPHFVFRVIPSASRIKPNMYIVNRYADFLFFIYSSSFIPYYYITVFDFINKFT